MRDPKRIERILNLIQEIWESNSDLRFMQLVDNLEYQYSNKNNGAFKDFYYDKYETDKSLHFTKMPFVDCFHLEDDKFEKFLEDHLYELKNY